jgi:hypothetical protein
VMTCVVAPVGPGCKPRSETRKRESTAWAPVAAGEASWTGVGMSAAEALCSELLREESELGKQRWFQNGVVTSSADTSIRRARRTLRSFGSPTATSVCHDPAS